MGRTALLATAAALVAAAPLAASAQGYDPQSSPAGPYQEQGGYPGPYSGPEWSYPQSGYPSSPPQTGYYPPAAYPQPAYPRSSYPSTTYPPSSYPDSSYPQAGYPQPTHPSSAYPRQGEGYAPPSYPRSEYGIGYNSGYDESANNPNPQNGDPRQQPTYTSPPPYDRGGNRAQTGGSLGSIFSCDAAGGKQAGGAVIGGLVGALAGRALARGDRSLGTGIGAAVGAATGSYIGCKMQREDVARASYATNQALTYSRAQSWSNADTGAFGTVNVYADNPRYAQYYGGSACRIVDQSFTTRSGGSQTERFRACREGADWNYTRL